MPAPTPGTPFRWLGGEASSITTGFFSAMTLTCGGFILPVDTMMIDAVVITDDDVPAPPTIVSVTDSKGNTWGEITDSGVTVGVYAGAGTALRMYRLNLWMGYMDNRLVAGDTVTVTLASALSTSSYGTFNLDYFQGLLIDTVDPGGNAYVWQDDASNPAVPSTSVTYTGWNVDAASLIGHTPQITTPDEQYWCCLADRPAYYQYTTTDDWGDPVTYADLVNYNSRVSVSGNGDTLSVFTFLSGSVRLNMFGVNAFGLLHGNAITTSFDPGMHQTSNLPAQIANSFKGGNWRVFKTTEPDPIHYAADKLAFRVA